MSLRKSRKSKPIPTAINREATVDVGIPISERKRIYYFPGGEKIILYNLTEIIVRKSGSHRIKTADGKFHIITRGWLHIEIQGTRNGNWVF